MTTQTLTIPVMLCNFALTPEEPISADSRDYGFDFDEEEIARELLAPLLMARSPKSPDFGQNREILHSAATIEIEADEFEQTYYHFLS